MGRRPIMIAVGGDSGTGKTTLCEGLQRIFVGCAVRTICLDDYRRLDRAQRKALGMTALEPRATNFAAMETDLRSLRRGCTIRKPVYDHADGTFGALERVEPREIILVKGLFPLYTRALRELFDFSVWLDPEPELKLAWKIRRDVLRRGYDEAEVREEIARRRHDLIAHVEPQASHADLIVRFFRPSDWEEHHDEARLGVRITVRNETRGIELAGPRHYALGTMQLLVARCIVERRAAVAGAA